MFKKIILGSSILAVMMSGSMAQAKEKDLFFATYQNNPETGWQLSALSSKEPEIIRPGLEEVLEIHTDSFIPAFKSYKPIEVGGRFMFDCEEKGPREYSPCYSSFTKPEGDFNDLEENFERLKSYDHKKISGVYLQTETPKQIEDFKISRKKFLELKTLKETLWVEIMDKYLAQWSEFEKSQKEFKQKLIINDQSGMFTKEAETKLPNLFHFRDLLPTPKRPDFLTDAYLEKYNPDNRFHVFNQLELLERAENSIIGKAKSFKENLEYKINALSRKVYLKYGNISYDGWELKVDGPKSLETLSSNKIIPVNVTVIGKNIKNIAPEIYINDGIIEVTFRKGMMVLKNLSDKDIELKNVKTKLNQSSVSNQTSFKILPGKSILIDAYKNKLIEENKFLKMTAEQAALKKIELKLNIEYLYDGGIQSIDAYSENLLSNLIRKKA